MFDDSLPLKTKLVARSRHLSGCSPSFTFFPNVNGVVVPAVAHYFN